MVAVGMLTFACTSSPEKNKSQEEKVRIANSPVFKKPPSDFEDTVTINRQSAVFFNTDSLQLKKIKAVNERNVYETITHDCYYMMQNARNVIRQHWPRIRIIEVTKVRYLLFVKKDMSTRCIDLNAKKNICGLFLFDPEKDPELIDMPNVDTYLGFYFGNN